MSAPFQPGDVVACIDDSPCTGYGIDGHFPCPWKRGEISRVVALSPCGLGVTLRPMKGPHTYIVAHRFRKIENDTGFDFREQIRAKPVRPALNPARHSREMV